MYTRQYQYRSKCSIVSVQFKTETHIFPYTCMNMEIKYVCIQKTNAFKMMKNSHNTLKCLKKQQHSVFNVAKSLQGYKDPRFCMSAQELDTFTLKSHQHSSRLSVAITVQSLHFLIEKNSCEKSKQTLDKDYKQMVQKIQACFENSLTYISQTSQTNIRIDFNSYKIVLASNYQASKIIPIFIQALQPWIFTLPNLQLQTYPLSKQPFFQIHTHSPEPGMAGIISGIRNCFQNADTLEGEITTQLNKLHLLIYEVNKLNASLVTQQAQSDSIIIILLSKCWPNNPGHLCREIEEMYNSQIGNAEQVLAQWREIVAQGVPFFQKMMICMGLKEKMNRITLAIRDLQNLMIHLKRSGQPRDSTGSVISEIQRVPLHKTVTADVKKFRARLSILFETNNPAFDERMYQEFYFRRLQDFTHELGREQTEVKYKFVRQYFSSGGTYRMCKAYFPELELLSRHEHFNIGICQKYQEKDPEVLLPANETRLKHTWFCHNLSKNGTFVKRKGANVWWELKPNMQCPLLEGDLITPAMRAGSKTEANFWFRVLEEAVVEFLYDSSQKVEE